MELARPLYARCLLYTSKNREKKRDPEAHPVKKGNSWHFGYKAHIGVDKDSGLAHTVKVTSANIHDVTIDVYKRQSKESALIVNDFTCNLGN